LGFPSRARGVCLGDPAAPGPDELPTAREHRIVGPEALDDRRYERQRRQLLETMRERGIHDLEVLRAFDLVPRHLFVPEAVRHRAYEDAPVPIGLGQTASQPSLQALYMQILRLQPEERVL